VQKQSEDITRLRKDNWNFIARNFLLYHFNRHYYVDKVKKYGAHIASTVGLVQHVNREF
jgi:hypothetical protein